MADISAYIEVRRKRAKLSMDADQRRVREAYQIAQRCVKVLVNEFGAHGVYLFGSLAGDMFRRSSDIDLIVEGLDPAIFFNAYSTVSRLAREFSVDLIAFEAYKYNTCRKRSG